MTAKARFPSFVDELPITHRALEFAAKQHQGQRREADHAPFILHPLEVAQLLRGRNYPDPVVAAGVLHDVIEDADVDPAELERRFGAGAALVIAVSEPPGEGDYRERKARLRNAIAAADADAAAVFAADKVAKARELRMALARHPGQLDADKLEHYWASLALLEHRLGYHPLVRQLRFELEALEAAPAEMRITRWPQRLTARERPGAT
jgi:(p)ppGpp synthase/HD superfamily hydrolase